MEKSGGCKGGQEQNNKKKNERVCMTHNNKRKRRSGELPTLYYDLAQAEIIMEGFQGCKVAK